MTSSSFQTAVAWVMAWEGGFQNDASDPGNWTGGAIGDGMLVGTKFGISAAAYPTMDIVNLTPQEAKFLYARDYWTPINGDALPAPVAMVVFDAAVNCGPTASAQWLQAVLGVTTDGIIGPLTLAAVANYVAAEPVPLTGWAALCGEVVAQRVAANGLNPTFSTNGLGWSRRISMLLLQAATML